MYICICMYIVVYMFGLGQPSNIPWTFSSQQKQNTTAEVMYVTQLPAENWKGIGWVFLNSIIAVVDRLLQRLLLSKEWEQRQWEQWDGTVGGWDSNPRCSVKRVQHHWLRSVSHCFTTQDWYPYGFMRQTVENNLMGFPKMGILSKWQCWTSKKWWWTIRGALEF